MHSALVKLEDGNVAITVQGNIAFTWGHEGIDHDTVKRAVDLLWYLSQDYLQVQSVTYL